MTREEAKKHLITMYLAYELKATAFDEDGAELSKKFYESLKVAIEALGTSDKAVEQAINKIMAKEEFLKMARLCNDSYMTCKECAFYQEPFAKCRVRLIQSLADLIEQMTCEEESK